MHPPLRNLKLPAAGFAVMRPGRATDPLLARLPDGGLVVSARGSNRVTRENLQYMSREWDEPRARLPPAAYTQRSPQLPVSSRPRGSRDGNPMTWSPADRMLIVEIKPGLYGVCALNPPALPAGRSRRSPLLIHFAGYGIQPCPDRNQPSPAPPDGQ